MDADPAVSGAAVAMAMGRARPSTWAGHDARAVAERLLAALPPFPPASASASASLSPSRSRFPEWSEFGAAWLARSRIPMDQASGWPACCSHLGEAELWNFKEAVVRAAWEAETGRQRALRLAGRPEEALVRLGAGWISPQGTVCVCTRLEHLQALRQAGVAPELFEAFDAACRRSQEDKDQFLEISMSGGDEDEDAHVPWHAYWSEADGEADRIRHSLVETAYGAGWIRLGVSLNRDRIGSGSIGVGCGIGHPRGRMLSAQGSGQALDEHATQLEELAEICGVELEMLAVYRPVYTVPQP